MKRKILVLDAFTNGHEAALRFIRKEKWRRRDCEIIFCGSHDLLLKKLCEGPAFAVVPVRNSIVGEISKVANQLTSLRDFGYVFEIVDELQLKINHCLLVKHGIGSAEELERVISHEEAIRQCQNFLGSAGLTSDKQSKRDSTGNAAKAVSRMSDQVKIGAIASRSAAKAYGLKILAENIQDVRKNLTTFRLLENKAEIKAVTVGLIGLGEFGTALKVFFESIGCTVIGSDPKVNQIRNSEVVKQADVVVFAVPIKLTPMVIRSVLPYIREDQLLMDITSVKQPSVEAMLRSKAQVVGLHPMFAPGVSFDGQTIVACPSRLTQGGWKTWTVNMLLRTGCKIKWSTPREHDVYMATVQASPHLANLVNALLIMEMGVSTKESLTFTSPFYRVMFSLMGRLLSQDPDLYASIAMKNPVTVEMLEHRIRIERRLLKIIKASDRRSFRKLFLKAREHFGKGVTDEANELFLRLNAVMKTLYGKNAVILEFGKSDNKPGLLDKLMRVFGKRGVNLAGINFANLGEKRLQFTVSFEQSKSSDEVRKALEEIEGWDSPKIRVIS